MKKIVHAMEILFLFDHLECVCVFFFFFFFFFFFLDFCGGI